MFYVDDSLDQGFNKLKLMKRTLPESSLSFTQGFPSTEDNLITMFSGLDFSVLPLDVVWKSFVKEVPIPNDTR